MTLRDSDDQVIYDTRPNMKIGSKWSVSDAVSDVETQLEHKDIVRTSQVDWRGIGYSGMIWLSGAADRQKRDQVALEVKRGEDESHV